MVLSGGKERASLLRPPHLHRAAGHRRLVSVGSDVADHLTLANRVVQGLVGKSVDTPDGVGGERLAMGAVVEEAAVEPVEVARVSSCSGTLQRQRTYALADCSYIVAVVAGAVRRT